MYCVGLTGNIGTGKSTVLDYFKELGIQTISADTIARQVTNTTEVLSLIRDYFGDHVFLSNGELNRKALRQLVFTEQEKRQWLEQLLHPLIRVEIENELSQVTSPYCVIEIPLLYHREAFPYINRIVLITTDETTQINRIMARDHCSQEQALAIIKNQPNQDSRKAIADDILVNNQGPEQLKKALLQLHKHYLSIVSLD